MRFITAHADRRSAGGLRWGVEPICTVLSGHRVKIAPSTYHAHLTRPAYWKPVYYALENRMGTWLLNAAHMKAVPGASPM